jgi:hypothetical protein
LVSPRILQRISDGSADGALLHLMPPTDTSAGLHIRTADMLGPGRPTYQSSVS